MSEELKELIGTIKKFKLQNEGDLEAQVEYQQLINSLRNLERSEQEFAKTLVTMDENL